MGVFSFEETKFKGVYLINTFSSDDNRGYFIKDFEKDVFIQNGLDIDLYESFESYSYKNVIRGLHFQTQDPQTKIVRAITGEVYDVIVDLRDNSDTFGKWEGYYLSQDNRISIYIPKGFAHGFRVLSETSIVSYKCIGKYHKGSDNGILWNDEVLSIPWGINDPIISERDSSLMTFKRFLQDYKALSQG